MAVPTSEPKGLAILADRSRPIPDAAKLPVVLIHGLFTGPWIMRMLGRSLRKDDRPVLYFGYSSRMRDIPDNAARFARWLEAQGPGPYDVVTHSLGGIILRWAAANYDLPRVRRVVMIAPPNRGAIIADKLEAKIGPLFRLIYGETGRQLRRGCKGLAEHAGQVDADVGVIAGGRRAVRGFNPWIDGDNDQTVALEETILPGMKAIQLVKDVRHSALLFNRETHGYVKRFLQTGRFREPAVDAVRDGLPRTPTRAAAAGGPPSASQAAAQG